MQGSGTHVVGGTRTVGRRTRVLVGLLATSGLVVPVLSAAPASAVGSSISINDPSATGAVTAGTVVLTGSVARGSETTTVLYALDATSSTRHFAGSDCTGDGALSTADDINADGSVGDVLDCEIGAVQRLNARLAAAADSGSRIRVGVEAFAELAEVADLSATGSETFAAPGDTGGETRPRIVTAATSVQRGAILQYDYKSLGGSGTTFDPVVATALGALSAAPAGPKWVILLSDGQTSVSAATLSSLHSSGVHLASFAVGASADCDPWGALAKLASASGERCVASSDPQDLASRLSAAQPDGIAGVTVSIGSTSIAAQLDPVGGWRASFTLGKGSYTATATATLTSGAKVSATRSFSVSAASGGPTPGSVTPGHGSLRATDIRAHRPRPSMTHLPPVVWGTAGRLVGRTVTTAKRLEGARVLLQARKSAGAPWVTMARGKLRDGHYSLTWQPHGGMRFLRVYLRPFGSFAGSADPVPAAYISGCTVRKHPHRWSMTCHTAAANRTKVLVYKHGHRVDRVRVARGVFTVGARGRLHGHELVLKLPHKRVHWAV